MKFKKLHEEFDRKYEAAAARYIQTKVDDLKEAQPGKAYNVLKTMGAQPGDCTDEQTFPLPGHRENNLTDEQCADQIADHFASISREFRPINLTLLPDGVKARPKDGTNPPVITEYECYLKLRAAKKPKAVIPGTYRVQ